jgi:hypothetical protein
VDADLAYVGGLEPDVRDIAEICRAHRKAAAGLARPEDLLPAKTWCDIASGINLRLAMLNDHEGQNTGSVAAGNGFRREGRTDVK